MNNSVLLTASESQSLQRRHDGTDGSQNEDVEDLGANQTWNQRASMKGEYEDAP
jgi:hypothetical protein